MMRKYIVVTSMRVQLIFAFQAQLSVALHEMDKRKCWKDDAGLVELAADCNMNMLCGMGGIREFGESCGTQPFPKWVSHSNTIVD